jgi:hypothetical protein
MALRTPAELHMSSSSPIASVNTVVQLHDLRPYVDLVQGSNLHRNTDLAASYVHNPTTLIFSRHDPELFSSSPPHNSEITGYRSSPTTVSTESIFDPQINR